jgi:DNA-binding transcriptional MerR regulator|tara:strand:+ start:27 stop:422 length:396 start_codon:yes stop_codon:yes gene_type:complete
MISIKDKAAYKTIGEIAKELDLIDKKTGSLQTHTLRYWEKQFKQIKPEIRAGNRRYYSPENFKNIKKIKYLLKVKGLTINGVKKILDNKDLGSLDENVNLGVYSPGIKNANLLKNKLKKISQIIKDLKKYK